MPRTKLEIEGAVSNYGAPSIDPRSSPQITIEDLHKFAPIVARLPLTFDHEHPEQKKGARHITVGKIVESWVNETEGSLWVKAEVNDDQVAESVKNGLLSGFSLGLMNTMATMNDGSTQFQKDVFELSIVPRPEFANAQITNVREVMAFGSDKRSPEVESRVCELKKQLISKSSYADKSDFRFKEIDVIAPSEAPVEKIEFSSHTNDPVKTTVIGMSAQSQPQQGAQLLPPQQQQQQQMTTTTLAQSNFEPAQSAAAGNPFVSQASGELDSVLAGYMRSKIARDMEIDQRNIGAGRTFTQPIPRNGMSPIFATDVRGIPMEQQQQQQQNQHFNQPQHQMQQDYYPQQQTWTQPQRNFQTRDQSQQQQQQQQQQQSSTHQMTEDQSRQMSREANPINQSIPDSIVDAAVERVLGKRSATKAQKLENESEVDKLKRENTELREQIERENAAAKTKATMESVRAKMSAPVSSTTETKAKEALDHLRQVADMSLDDIDPDADIDDKDPTAAVAAATTTTTNSDEVGGKKAQMRMEMSIESCGRLNQTISDMNRSIFEKQATLDGENDVEGKEALDLLVSQKKMLEKEYNEKANESLDSLLRTLSTVLGSRGQMIPSGVAEDFAAIRTKGKITPVDLKNCNKLVQVATASSYVSQQNLAAVQAELQRLAMAAEHKKIITQHADQMSKDRADGIMVRSAAQNYDAKRRAATTLAAASSQQIVQANVQAQLAQSDRDQLPFDIYRELKITYNPSQPTRIAGVDGRYAGYNPETSMPVGKTADQLSFAEKTGLPFQLVDHRVTAAEAARAAGFSDKQVHFRQPNKRHITNVHQANDNVPVDAEMGFLTGAFRIGNKEWLAAISPDGAAVPYNGRELKEKAITKKTFRPRPDWKDKDVPSHGKFYVLGTPESTL